MFTSFIRILRYGLAGVIRNIWLSLATTLVMIFALIVFHGLILFNVLGRSAVGALEDKIDIAVYFKIDASEADMAKLEEELKKRKEIASVEYISRDKALERFREKHQSNTTISKALEELNSNPLLASLTIKARDPRDYENINSFLGKSEFIGVIEKVTYSQLQLAIERLNSLIDTGRRVGFALTLFLTFTSILVTFNTIRLVIHSNREEIGIMRLVGASNNFINGPYIIEGILLGIFAAVMSLLIMIPAVRSISPHVASFIPELDLAAYTQNNFLKLFGYQLLFGVGLGVFSSIIAIRKYLKV